MFSTTQRRLVGRNKQWPTCHCTPSSERQDAGRRHCYRPSPAARCPPAGVSPSICHMYHMYHMYHMKKVFWRRAAAAPQILLLRRVRLQPFNLRGPAPHARVVTSVSLCLSLYDTRLSGCLHQDSMVKGHREFDVEDGRIPLVW